MKPGQFLIFFAGILVLNLGSCRKKEAPEPSNDILINQIGYLADAQKVALLRINADEFTLKTLDGKTAFEGQAGHWKYWKLSGDSVRLADFSSLKTPGEYVLWAGDKACSYPFRIGTELYAALADAALKSYFYARSGMDLTPEFAGQWSRKGGHPDTAVVVHVSAADGYRPKGTVLSSPGGWYDAGDYNKYIVNSGISTYTLLLSGELNKAFHTDQNLDIPDSGNGMPDILDEALYNLNWMLTMQDPNDGGVYHKLTTKNFEGFVKPVEATADRYVVQKSTAATLDFAATMAHASRVVAEYGMDELSAKMRESAEKAWIWALRHPKEFYKQPEDIFTGAYGDTSLTDEWYWAAAEMYLNDTRSRTYLDGILEHWQKPGTPSWNNVNTLGVISLLTSEERPKFAAFEAGFLAHVNSLLEKEKSSPYLISVEKFEWGSNSDVANDGMLKLIAYRLTGDKKYAWAARNDLDYLLGRNATGYSFVTGYGSLTPMHLHQRVSASDGIDEPVPGFLAGGPNISVMNDCEPEKVERSPFPAKSYVDKECSYSTNETAINWNAPLVFLVSGLELFDRESKN